MIRFRLLAAALGSAILLAACAAPKAVKPTPPPVAESYANLPSAGNAAIPDLGDWWQRFDDPVLNQLVQAALAENLDLKTAVSRIDAARALRTATAAERRPQVDLNAGATRQRYPAAQSWTFEPVTANVYGVNASASWELDVFGRIRRNVAAADADLAATQDDARAVRVAVVGEVVQTYLAVRGLERRLDLVGTNAHNQAETETFTRQMFDAGEVPLADVDRAQTQREATAAELPALALQRQSALDRLSILTAATPQQVYAQLKPVAKLPAWAPPAGVGTPADLLRRRPDVRAAEARVIAAYARVGVAEAELKPHLRLAGVLGAAVNGFSGASFARSIAWMAGAGASTPLFDGKRRRSVVALRRAEAEQALYAYRATVLAAVAEVETALAATERHRVRVEGLARAAASARSAYGQIDQSWRSGESAFIDTLQVQSTLLEAEDQLAQAQTLALQSQASLMTALGQGQ
ncbi:efflux transporter outer membrane subunit [Frateuria defendens]|uniref:efflux transporter outer membrane subunit n=1 Tax=Frateuria defendens TaxID=2219559 RepID=UPI001929AC81|nr:efflux transporter outer membrane subunit [Frateuria defendens]